MTNSQLPFSYLTCTESLHFIIRNSFFRYSFVIFTPRCRRHFSGPHSPPKADQPLAEDFVITRDSLYLVKIEEDHYVFRF